MAPLAMSVARELAMLVANTNCALCHDRLLRTSAVTVHACFPTGG
jgi:hypothetical protein